MNGLKQKRGGKLLTVFAVMSIAAIFSLTLLGCPTGSDPDPDPTPTPTPTPTPSVSTHLLSGKMSRSPFYVDRKTGSSPSTSMTRSSRSYRAADEPEILLLEGKFEGGEGDDAMAMQITGAYEPDTGKFMLTAASESLGIGFALEGYVGDDGMPITDDPDKPLKAYTKEKAADGVWTQTEVPVPDFFDTTDENALAELDAETLEALAELDSIQAQDADDIPPHLPEEWFGKYRFAEGTEVFSDEFKTLMNEKVPDGKGGEFVNALLPHLYVVVSPIGIDPWYDSEAILELAPQYAPAFDPNAASNGGRDGGEDWADFNDGLWNELYFVWCRYFISICGFTESSENEFITVATAQEDTGGGNLEDRFVFKCLKVKITGDGSTIAVQQAGNSGSPTYADDYAEVVNLTTYPASFTLER
jgi:hypothetical protein